MKINHVVGDATNPRGSGHKIIVHICNDSGAWGAGFVLAISRRWPALESEYRSWAEGRYVVPFKLGKVLYTAVHRDITVANLIGQKGIRSVTNPVPVRYEAIWAGLADVAGYTKLFRGASIHVSRIGCGLGGGSWVAIEPMLKDHFISKNIPVTVYDLKKWR